MLKERVHIIPVGFEKDRIVLPVLKLKADRVYLIVESESDSVKNFVEYAKKEFKKYGISFEEVKCHRNDLFKNLLNLREIIEKEKKNLIYINISSGSTVTSIAGVMASMLFKEKNISIIPYYAKPTRYISEGKKPESSGLDEIFEIPNYETHLPKPHLIKVMKFIGGKTEGIRKKDLVDFVLDNGIATQLGYGSILGKKPFTSKRIEKQKEASNLHMWVNHNIIDKLKEWNLLEIEGNGKKTNIQLNKNGSDMIKFL